MKKKLILFLVEGVTEKISLGMIFSELIRDNNTEFHIINDDITSRHDVNSKNAIEKVNEEIKSFLEREHYQKEDILKIAHLVDTDGVYIPESCIEEHDTENILYRPPDKILCSTPENIIDRNEKKRQVLNRFIFCQEINNIDYRVYYFSCNLEHVLHDSPNVKDENKSKKAEKFEERFHNKEQEFLEFIENDEFAVEGDYRETWDFIRENNNSLKRYSNLHLYFKK